MRSFSEKEVPAGVRFTVTCQVEGGDKPHKVTLTKPDNAVLTWLQNK